MVGFDEDENNDDAAVAPVSADALTGQMAAMKIEDNNNSSNLEARKRQQLLVSLDNNDTEQNIYSYFDAATLKNWAGPQHWKVQRPRNQTQQQQKTTKAPRQQFTIDFSDCNELIDSKQLFAKDTRKTTLMSSRSIKNADANAAKLLLPRDLHYTLQDLTQLFMKPSMRVCALRSYIKYHMQLRSHCELHRNHR
jgi:condensin complex subunit 2